MKVAVREEERVDVECEVWVKVAVRRRVSGMMDMRARVYIGRTA